MTSTQHVPILTAATTVLATAVSLVMEDPAQMATNVKQALTLVELIRYALTQPAHTTASAKTASKDLASTVKHVPTLMNATVLHAAPTPNATTSKAVSAVNATLDTVGMDLHATKLMNVP